MPLHTNCPQLLDRMPLAKYAQAPMVIISVVTFLRLLSTYNCHTDVNRLILGDVQQYLVPVKIPDMRLTMSRAILRLF
jgi:hypothetical protein